MDRSFSLFPLLIVLPLLLAVTPAPPDTSEILIDDFRSYPAGEFPDEWVFVTEDKEIRTYEEVYDEGEEAFIAEEEGRKFFRFHTVNEAQRYSKRNGVDFDWNLRDHPRLQWEWRALQLPEGASERGKNDTGAAVYVTFGTDWLGRPKSIKYTYSSSLPVGSVVSFGPLKVIVVDSATEPRLGEWKQVRRNVIADYRQAFGGDPPSRPVSITLWSDSDSVNGVAKVDFDNIKLLPRR